MALGGNKETDLHDGGSVTVAQRTAQLESAALDMWIISLHDGHLVLALDDYAWVDEGMILVKFGQACGRNLVFDFAPVRVVVSGHAIYREPITLVVGVVVEVPVHIDHYIASVVGILDRESPHECSFLFRVEHLDLLELTLDPVVDCVSLGSGRWRRQGRESH